MRKWLYTGIALILVAIAAYTYRDHIRYQIFQWQYAHRTDLGKAVEIGDLQPLGAAPSVTAADLQGKVVVMDFWATWCLPCVKGFPVLEELKAQYADHPDVVFVAVNVGYNDTVEKAEKMVAQSDYTFAFAYDRDQKMSQKVTAFGIPTTCVLDRDGVLRYRETGYTLEEIRPQIAATLDGLLAGSP